MFGISVFQNKFISLRIQDYCDTETDETIRLYSWIETMHCTRVKVERVLDVEIKENIKLSCKLSKGVVPFILDYSINMRYVLPIT